MKVRGESIPQCCGRKYLSKTRMARILGKKVRWVERELRLMQLRLEWVVHNSSNPVIYHAPCILTYLRLVDALVPAANGSWVTRNEIIKLLDCGLTHRTANKLLKSYAGFARLRKDSGGRVYPHYPLQIVSLIRCALAEKLENVHG